MTGLPAGWRWDTIGGVAEVTGGLTKNAGKRDVSKNRVPLVSVAAVHLRRIVTEAVGEVGLLESDGNRATLDSGDLLVVEGNGSLEHIGRVALWNNEVPGARHQNHIIRVRPREIAPRYLLEWLASPDGRSAIVNEATSATGLYTLSLSKVERLPIPVPPKGEEGRIVAKLEALQSRSRHAREALDTIPGLEEQLVRWWTRPQLREGALGPHLVDKTREVGDTWHQYPLVGLSNNGEINDRREPIGQCSAQKYRVVEQGDIVFNPIRFSIGSIARYRRPTPGIVSPEYQVITTRETLSSELLVRYLRTPAGRSRLGIQTTGSVRYRVYLKDLERLIVPLAPPSEQKDAETRLALLSALVPKLNAIRVSLDELEQAILSKAFRGELVEQHLSDTQEQVISTGTESASSSAPQRRNAHAKAAE